MRLLVEELKDSKNLEIFHIAGRKPFMCLEQSSALGEIISKCYAIEVRATKGVD